jgi:SAM-dependent methyltransferase
MTPEPPRHEPSIDNLSPTERFSGRVAEYVSYRPTYPDGILNVLAEEADLSEHSGVADIGSGTGISAELLLRSGCTVYAVEPNHAMRAAAESLLGANERFHSVPGTAEATNLASSTFDLVVAAQAFHWFDIPSARREFARILKPAGLAALLWNIRLTDATPFLSAYDALLREYAIGYRDVMSLTLSTERLRQLYRSAYRTFEFSNEQSFDLLSLKGRLLSSSYTPTPEHPRHQPMLRELREIFNEHQREGHVRVLYKTQLHLGRVGVGSGTLGD